MSSKPIVAQCIKIEDFVDFGLKKMIMLFFLVSGHSDSRLIDHIEQYYILVLFKSKLPSESI